MASNKKKKIDCMGEGRPDRLSNLPYNIRIRILSFLPITKHTVQTCILAKRWRNLWTCLPDLDFDCMSFTSDISFEKFVSGVILHRNTKSLVRKCRFFHWSWDCRSPTNEVINYAIFHEVKHLIIELRSKYYMLGLEDHADAFQFKSSSLQILELECLAIDITKGLLKFSKLTTLRLEDCLIIDGTISFEHLNLLKNLRLVNCDFRNVQALKVKGSYLESFTIVLGIKSSAESFVGCKVEIVAPKLTCFRWKALAYFDFSTVDLSFVDLPCVEHANIQLFSPKPEVKAFKYLLKLFERLHNAQYVTLNSDIIEDLMKAHNLLEHQIPPFSRLKSLKLEVRDSAFKSSARLVKVMAYLLGGSPFAICELVPDDFVVQCNEVQRAILQATLKVKTCHGYEVSQHHLNGNLCLVTKEGSKSNNEASRGGLDTHVINVGGEQAAEEEGKTGGCRFDTDEAGHNCYADSNCKVDETANTRNNEEHFQEKIINNNDFKANNDSAKCLRMEHYNVQDVKPEHDKCDSLADATTFPSSKNGILHHAHTSHAQVSTGTSGEGMPLTFHTRIRHKLYTDFHGFRVLSNHIPYLERIHAIDGNFWEDAIIKGAAMVSALLDVLGEAISMMDAKWDSLTCDELEFVVSSIEDALDARFKADCLKPFAQKAKVALSYFKTQREITLLESQLKSLRQKLVSDTREVDFGSKCLAGFLH